MCLESLGRTKEKFADFLEPLVESCLPEPVLRAWERSRTVGDSSEKDSGRSLEQLLLFLQKEVKGEEMITLARTGLGPPQKSAPNRVYESSSLFTSESLVNGCPDFSGERKNYIFCSKLNRNSFECFRAKKNVFRRQKVVIQKRSCFKCLGTDGHISRNCKLKIKCNKCQKGHYILMCPQSDIAIPENDLTKH